MLIKANINEKYHEMELHVCKDEMDHEVKDMVKQLHDWLDRTVSATDERGNKVSLKPSDVVSFYAEGQKVYALGKTEKYAVSKKLYELEQELESSFFARISKSELINIHKIQSLDMSMTGTIKIIMKNGYETFTSRRNVGKIKKLVALQSHSR